MSQLSASARAEPFGPLPLNSLSRGRIPSLDGLRAVGVLMVMTSHIIQTRGFPARLSTTLWWFHGEIGVDVFFVISGFLITTLMLREIDRAGRLDVKSFYLRRALRILPAYFLFLAALAFMQHAGYVLLRTKDWLAAMTYTTNFLGSARWEMGHLWSLSIEEHFYLLWPAVILMGTLRARWFALFLIVGCFIARWVVLLKFPAYSAMAEIWTFTRLDTIAFGCLLALLAWDDAWRNCLDRFLLPRATAIAAAGLLLIFMLQRTVPGKISIGIGRSAISAMITVLMWILVRRAHSTFGKFLNHRAIAAVGVLSYSLYLWQQIFLDPDRTALPQRFPLNLLFTFAAALASYWCIERPFLKMKDKIGARHHGKTATVNATN